MKPKSRDNIPTTEERESLIGVCKTEEETLVVKGLLYSGMRISEFIHMNRSWIDWKGSIINIPARTPCKCSQDCIKPHYKYFKYDKETKKRIKLASPVLTKPKNTWQVKTKNAQRPIPIVPELRGLLESYFKTHNSVMDILDSRIHAWKVLKRVGIRAKIRHPVFPHAMRAYFVTKLVELGIEDPVTLCQIMGWAKPDMAMVYVRLSPHSLKRKVMNVWNSSQV